MKKLIALSLALISAFSITACSAEKTTASTLDKTTTGTTATTGTTGTTATTATTANLQNATAKDMLSFADEALANFRDADSFRSKVNCTMTMKYGKITTTENMTMELSAKDLNTSPEWFRTSTTEDDYGAQENSSVYFKDGYFYATKCGLRGKIYGTESAMAELGYEKTFDSFIAKLPVNNTEKVEVTSLRSSGAGRDDKWWVITIDNKKSIVLLQDYYDLMTSSFLSADENVKVEVSAPTEKIVLTIRDDGTLISYRATISVDVTAFSGVASATTTIQTDFSFNVNDMNGDVTVEAPDDLTLYRGTTEKEFGYTFLDFAYQDFAEKSDVEASSSCSIGMQISGVNMTINMGGKLWANNFNTDYPIIRETAAMEIAGQSSAKTDFYFKNGYYYVSTTDTEGKSSQMKLSDEEYKALYGEPDFTVIRRFGSLDFEDHEIYADSFTGNTEILFAINPGKFKFLFADDIDAVKTLAVGTYEVTDMQVYDAQIMATLTKNGKLHSYTVYYVLELTAIVNGTPTTVVCTVNDVTTINSTENVTVPEIPNISSFKTPNETV